MKHWREKGQKLGALAALWMLTSPAAFARFRSKDSQIRKKSLKGWQAQVETEPLLIQTNCIMLSSLAGF